MNNAEIFSQTFGIYATEMWAMPESEFLSWLNSLHDVNATNTTDTISRQVAINTTENMYGVCNTGHTTDYKDLVIKALEEAPSAEPQIIRCKDCKWYEKWDKESSYGYCHAMKHCHYSKHWEISIYRTYNEDFFCADAERREEE